jgi:TPR repeat protein
VFAFAQYNLGVMCETGHGGSKDYAEARQWFQAAADQGNASAQFSLGVLYEYGYGVAQDYAEAVKWYRKGADQGMRLRSSISASCATTAGACRRIMSRLHKWLNLAAARFLPAEHEKRARATKNRDLVAKRMTPSQIADAQKSCPRVEAKAIDCAAVRAWRRHRMGPRDETISCRM